MVEPTTVRSMHSVLFVTLAGDLGGSVRSLITVLRRMDAVKRVVAAPDHYGLARVLDEEEIADERISLELGGRGTRPASATRIARWVARNRHDLACIHANSLADANVVMPAALLYRIPVVIWVHDSEASTAVQRLAWTWRAARSLHFACVSEVAREVVQEIAPWATVSVVPNPIDPAEVVAERSDRSRDPVVVGYLGTTSPNKGFQFLPGLIAGLAEESLRWAIFAGPRHWMTETWEELHELRRLRGNIELSDRLDDVRAAYQECDLVVCPSGKESFGRVAAEAMLNGIPVVASDIPALRALVDGAGALFPPGDCDAMAEAVRRLARDSDLRQEMGSLARRRASEFSPQLIVEKLLELYVRAAQAGGRPVVAP